MKNQNENRLFFVPSQVIEYGKAIILRRGVLKIKLEGEQIADVINVIMTLASEDGATEQQLLEYFGEDNTGFVQPLISELKDKGFLIERISGSGESPKDISQRESLFYDQSGMSEESRKKLKSTVVHIIGVNFISKNIMDGLIDCGVENIVIVDYPFLRNMEFFTNEGNLIAEKFSGKSEVAGYSEWIENLEWEKPQCLIATSDFGGMYSFRDFNLFCVENNIHFLPAVYQDYKGYIGPLVIPGYTPCYECFIQRQNANMNGFEVRRTIELSDFEGQGVIESHPIMNKIIADIVVMEFVKFYGNMVQFRNSGKVIEVNLMATELKSQQVLKVPRCPHCGTLKNQSETTVMKSTFMPTHYE
jgi:thiazole/oxazole-forming peptide maturase SagC family component